MKNKKEKTILVSGHFNVLHAGHLRLFKTAKELASRLIVAVESDMIAGSKAHLNEKLRFEAINEISIIDECFIMNDEITEVINRIRPNFVLKGKEFEKQFNLEKEALDSYGGKLIFNSGDTSFSSLDLITKEISLEGKIEIPKNYKNTHGISNSKLLRIIDNFKNLNVAVIGDLLIDEYIECDPIGMSQEEPALVVTPINQKKYIGGAGIVSLHAKSLGANVDFYTVTGIDDKAKYASKEIEKHNVNLFAFEDITRPTSVKTRFRSNGKSLLRVSTLKQHNISANIQSKIFSKIKKNFKKYQLVVFSDFNYGVLSSNLVEKIGSLSSSKKNVFFIADSQSSSQIGDISKFKNMNLITPTEREARLATRNSQDGIVIMMEELRKNCNSDNIILTLGENGIIIQSGEMGTSNFYTDSLPAFNKNPIDVSGAGDSLLISSGLSLASGSTIWEAALIGSLTASIQVSQIGNNPINSKTLKKKII